MTSSAKKLTFQAILIMFFSNFLSRVIGFVRTATFGSLVGATGEGDAYTFSFLIPEILNHLLAGSALSIAFIPIFQKLNEEEDPTVKWKFFSNLFWIGTIVFTVFLCISELFTPQIVQILGGSNLEESKLTPIIVSQITSFIGSLVDGGIIEAGVATVSTSVPAEVDVFSLTVKLTRIIIPAQLFFFWGALFNGVQYANKKFFLPSMTPVAYNVFIILLGVILYPYIGVEGFSWGVLAGAFIGNVMLQVYGVKKCGAKLYFHLDIKEKNMREWFIKTLPLMLGVSVVFSNEFMIRKFGAHSSDGEGSIVALDYAYRIFMVLVGLFGQSIAAGIYPFISKLANDNKIREIEELLFPVLYKVAALLLTSSVVIYFLGGDVVSLVFERKAFDQESAIITTKALLGFLPGAFFLAAVLILNRLYYSTKRTITPLVISSLSLLVSLPLYFVLDTIWGVRGIALASSLFAIICFVLLVLYWKRLHKESLVLAMLRKLVAIAIVALLIGGATFTTLQIPFVGELSGIVRIILVSAIIGSIAIFVYDRMQIISISSIMKKIRRRS